ncbi:hypothetical protein GQ600_11811 [Phytophthora cactorum]|nr:hypothetical protein GQ600_11811 [Phytophthora cactorum]
MVRATSTPHAEASKNPWETTFYCVERSEARGRGVPDDSTNAKGRSTSVKRCATMTETGRRFECAHLLAVHAVELAKCDNLEGSESYAVKTGSASSDTGAVQTACI